VGQDQRATGTPGATEHSQAGSGQGQHVTEVLSLILPALYLGCAIWSSTETPKHPWVTAAGGGNANRGTGKFFRRSKAASRPPQWASQGGGQWSFNGKNTQSSCNVDGWANASIRYLHSACSKGPGLYWLL